MTVGVLPDRDDRFFRFYESEEFLVRGIFRTVMGKFEDLGLRHVRQEGFLVREIAREEEVRLSIRESTHHAPLIGFGILRKRTVRKKDFERTSIGKRDGESLVRLETRWFLYPLAEPVLEEFEHVGRRRGIRRDERADLIVVNEVGQTTDMIGIGSSEPDSS